MSTPVCKHCGMGRWWYSPEETTVDVMHDDVQDHKFELRSRFMCAFCGGGCRGDLRAGCECYDEARYYCSPEHRGRGCPNGLLMCASCERGDS